ncbi:snRNA-activating protein complex subunit 4 isoform X1 [Synchiropus splendidus]|uniref:snRNA-activating protein complex subunit 4 isoform X1 n=2 Tax=Synchiropus splendidus TaxID=270530 RepID=UPI00237E4EF5|nr:snRNA-activating protein complex subunit 4 isoform X1 [Synchiropus splendidus]
MSVSLSEERDRLQRQVQQLEQSLVANIDLMSSETDEDSDEDDQMPSGLLAQRDKVQSEIQDLENVLGSYSPASNSEDGDDADADDDDDDEEDSNSELGLSRSVDSCLQMNLVYQQVLQETLNQLEVLLSQNHREQRQVESLLNGPIRDQPHSAQQQPIKLYLGHFMKPYFKDKVTGLGPPANPESQEKSRRTSGCLDERLVKSRKWESWQKTLLIHAVSRDHLRRLVQPKLSKVDYLTQKLTAVVEAERPPLRLQIEALEREVDLLRQQNQEELIGDRYCDHDWQKISNIDFEGSRLPGDLQLFWQNFLHPSINKTTWSRDEVQKLKELCNTHQERHWEEISQELGTGRTAFMCLQTFQRFVSDSLKRGAWTPEEDAQLRQLVDKMRIGNFVPYTQISYFMEGRDVSQLVYRWSHVLDPNIKKGPWTKFEDQLLLRAVSHYGEKSWWKIRMEVPGRTDGACRDRYYDCLKAGTKRGPFDHQERALLLKLVKAHGVGRWAKIAAEIPNRNDGQCLKAWKTLSRTVDSQCWKKKAVHGKNGKKRKLKVEESEEEECEEEDEEDEEEVPYMDSDEEQKSSRSRKKPLNEREDQEMYQVPRLLEWIPQDQPEELFQQVELSSVSSGPERERSTLAGQSGRSVHVGPCPQEVKWAGPETTLMQMLTAQKLQRQLVTKQSGLKQAMLSVVLPWVGNVLFPLKTQLTAADLVREETRRSIPSVTFFRLLLQLMSVDTVGCKEVIGQRSSGPAHPAPPDAAAIKAPNPKTVRGMLQAQRDCKEKQVVQDKAAPVYVKLLSPPHLSAAPLQTWILTPPTTLLPLPPSTSLSASQGPASSPKNAPLVSTTSPPASTASPALRTSSEEPVPSHLHQEQTTTLGRRRVRKKTPKAQDFLQSQTRKKCSGRSGPARSSRNQNQRGNVFPAPLRGKQLLLPVTATRPVTMVPSSSILVLQPPSPAPRPQSLGVQTACPLRDCLSGDPTLMFIESREEVRAWLTGPEAVAVAGLNKRLPYLPPCLSSLNMLSELLQARESLIRSSALLLCPTTGPELTTPDMAKTPLLQKEQCDSRASTEDSVVQHEEVAEEQVDAIRLLVKERYAGNPAYQMLKSRILSCLTLPSLLATVAPFSEKARSVDTDGEEEGEEEEDEQEEDILRTKETRGAAWA